MAINYYDEAITQKIKGWLADSSKVRVLGPDESDRLFKIQAEDSGDKPLKLPLIALSRNKEITIESTVKQNKSFDGLIIGSGSKANTTLHFNVIPIKTTYQLDIYTKKQAEADEYIRQYLFKLINNPQIIIDITYNGYLVRHTANLRVLDSVSDNSDISAHIFPGQFYRWTIQLELHDGFLFSIPVKDNWTLSTDFTETDGSIIEDTIDVPEETPNIPSDPEAPEEPEDTTGSIPVTKPSDKAEFEVTLDTNKSDNWEIIIENL